MAAAATAAAAAASADGAVAIEETPGLPKPATVAVPEALGTATAMSASALAPPSLQVARVARVKAAMGACAAADPALGQHNLR
mmetsp:Transcript_26701/g.88702  ORF Transcript_26701/g.88702 Transcript_26701/m.88702 type:complete len:83 (-) Transcript_26701:50-298(-)